jgi:hypothetical protein
MREHGLDRRAWEQFAGNRVYAVVSQVLQDEDLLEVRGRKGGGRELALCAGVELDEVADFLEEQDWDTAAPPQTERDRWDTYLLEVTRSVTWHGEPLYPVGSRWDMEAFWCVDYWEMLDGTEFRYHHKRWGTQVLVVECGQVLWLRQDGRVCWVTGAGDARAEDVRKAEMWKCARETGAIR